MTSNIYVASLSKIAKKKKRLQIAFLPQKLIKFRKNENYRLSNIAKFICPKNEGPGDKALFLGLYLPLTSSADLFPGTRD